MRRVNLHHVIKNQSDSREGYPNFKGGTNHDHNGNDALATLLLIHCASIHSKEQFVMSLKNIYYSEKYYDDVYEYR